MKVVSCVILKIVAFKKRKGNTGFLVVLVYSHSLKAEMLYNAETLEKCAKNSSENFNALPNQCKHFPKGLSLIG